MVAIALYLVWPLIIGSQNCPSPPPGFTRLLNHCVGTKGDCARNPLHSGNCANFSVVECVTKVCKNCTVLIDYLINVQ